MELESDEEMEVFVEDGGLEDDEGKLVIYGSFLIFDDNLWKLDIVGIFY